MRLMGQAALGSDHPSDHRALARLTLEAGTMLLAAENGHSEAKLPGEAGEFITLLFVTGPDFPPPIRPRMLC